MSQRKLVATDMGMAQSQASLNRPVAITFSGTNLATYTFPTNTKMMFTITDIVLSGSGTFTIREGNDPIFSITFSGTFTFSPKISLNVDLAQPVTFTFSGNGDLKANLYGYYVRK
ncbi:hypothetical protein [Candidatus Caldatribacterium sp.]|uniref:hypothetical protein n=1 Tax=Candidatus Caldatribacterium sp. TaxID=2282143 RepID=UPI00383C5230|nr:hypothetical protein [Candidatus Caldatribacterium sp.]